MTHFIVAEAEPATAVAQPEPVDELGKYAVIDIGGHQMLVEEGRWYTCNRLEAEPGSKLLLGRVLALKEAGQFHVGRPYLEDVRVEANVMAEVKAPKVVIFKMHAKKHYRRKTGHRQPLTKFLITKIARA
ncbi:hypothetical protein WJX81_000391 [Elliptochloris bilobata]|uniref:50S ribosomal protein L21 n=1 Tax=Elliptochloris bilobata TaxID=381761 RepID=A0AAW1RJY4_9CHLO